MILIDRDWMIFDWMIPDWMILIDPDQMILIAITDNVNNAMKSEKIIESRYIWHYM